jgi:hypothetical protein
VMGSIKSSNYCLCLTLNPGLPMKSSDVKWNKCQANGLFRRVPSNEQGA